MTVNAMTARHDDLDLTDPEDRAIYRQRVAVEYGMMKLDRIRAEAGVASNCTRQLAVGIIANNRMKAMGIKIPSPKDP